MSTADCNGVKINYRCVGEGRDLVLIHGLAANHAFWNFQVLLTLAHKFRVTVYDLRGHGYSEMPESGYTSEDMADDLHQLLNKLDISQAHLIGHSFGGVVALQYAAKYPERVSSLILADSRIRAIQPDHKIKNWPNNEEAMKKLEELGFSIPEDESESGIWLLEQLASPKWRKMRHKLKGTPLFIPFGGWNGGQRTADRWTELLRSTTARKDLTSIAGLTKERLASIRQPVLAVCGEKSPVMPSLAGLKNCMPKLMTDIVPGAGHFFPLSFPKLFVNIVTPFLEETELVDRRDHKRFAHELKVDLRGNDGASFHAETVNVSRQGILIESIRKLEIGSDVEVIAKFKKDDEKVAIRSKVVRMTSKEGVSDYRYGIELCPGDPGYQEWEDFLETLTQVLVD